MWFFFAGNDNLCPCLSLYHKQAQGQPECHSYVGQRSLAQEQPPFSFKNHREEIINKAINHNAPKHTPISVGFLTYFPRENTTCQFSLWTRRNPAKFPSQPSPHFTDWERVSQGEDTHCRVAADEHDADLSAVDGFLLFLVQEAKESNGCPLETHRSRAAQACSVHVELRRAGSPPPRPNPGRQSRGGPP